MGPRLCDVAWLSTACGCIALSSRSGRAPKSPHGQRTHLDGWMDMMDGWILSIARSNPNPNATTPPAPPLGCVLWIEMWMGWLGVSRSVRIEGPIQISKSHPIGECWQTSERPAAVRATHTRRRTPAHGSERVPVYHLSPLAHTHPPRASSSHTRRRAD